MPKVPGAARTERAGGAWRERLQAGRPGRETPPAAVRSLRPTDLPIIFLTEFGDVPKATAGLKAGAVDLLEKPVDSDVLIEAIQRAMEIRARRGAERARQQQLEELYSHLTPREKEIIVLLARGYSAKQVGRALGISHRTAEIHRARNMEKLGVQSLADLVALAIRIGIR